VILRNACSNSSFVLSASTSRAISMKRFDCSGSSRGGLGLRGIGQYLKSGGFWRINPRRSFSECAKRIGASRTFIDSIVATKSSKELHKRSLSVLVTMCAKPMRRFGAASVWLQHEGKCTRSKTFQFVFILLSIPLFKASHFLFKRAYALQSRKLRLLCGEDLFLECYDRPLRMAASLMSFSPFAISSMALNALKPA
jgi:hypothetical protein